VIRRANEAHPAQIEETSSILPDSTRLERESTEESRPSAAQVLGLEDDIEDEGDVSLMQTTLVPLPGHPAYEESGGEPPDPGSGPIWLAPMLEPSRNIQMEESKPTPGLVSVPVPSERRPELPLSSIQWTRSRIFRAGFFVLCVGIAGIFLWAHQESRRTSGETPEPAPSPPGLVQPSPPSAPTPEGLPVKKPGEEPGGEAMNGQEAAAPGGNAPEGVGKQAAQTDDTESEAGQKGAGEQVKKDEPNEKNDQKALKALINNVIEVPDRAARLKAVANYYLDKKGDVSQRPLMITGTHADRKDLNELVRTALEARGELQGGRVHGEILINRSLTEAERKDPLSYRVGDVIRFDRGYKKLGIDKGEYLAVESVGREPNLVELRGEGGKVVSWQPGRFKKVEVYEQEKRELRVGDLVRFTRKDRERGWKNGETGRVVVVDEESRSVVVETKNDSGQAVRHAVGLGKDRHWENGYASTLDAAQGRTTDEVVIHLDTSQKQVMGHEGWYVAVTRARDKLTVFTDSREKLLKVIIQMLSKESALQAVEKSQEGRGVEIER